MNLVLGSVTNALISYPYTKDGALLSSEVTKSVIFFCCLGIGTFAVSWLQMLCFMWAGENQAKRLRQEYFKAIMRKSVAYFDLQETGNLTYRLSGNIVLIQEAISEKVGNFIQVRPL